MILKMPEKKKDTDFMSDLEASKRLEPSYTSALMLWVIAGLMIFLIFWAGVSRVEEITRGGGQVVPSGDIQIVQSLEGGILQELLVNEGDRVKQGDVLLRISDITFSSEERGVEARRRSLLAKKARLLSEAKGEDFAMPEDIKEKAPKIAENEYALYQSRRQELGNAYSMLDEKINSIEAQLLEIQADINSFQNSRSLLQEELEITKEMVAQQAMPKLEEIRLKREVSELAGKTQAARERQKALQAELKSAQREREDQEDKARTQAYGELNEVETQLAELEESLKSIGDRVDRTEIRSPVTGVVNKLSIKTLGGVIEPAQRVAEVVPLEDNLKIVAKISPNDIAFIDQGQDVKVKILAYDPSRYGSLKGKLSRIGANTVSDAEGNMFFEVEVITEKNHMGPDANPLPITPGMIAEIEIITGKRSILSYLLKPIVKAFDRALTER